MRLKVYNKKNSDTDEAKNSVIKINILDKVYSHCIHRLI